MKNKGFTLIELLVVVAIIGVLAGIVVASLGDARARARDAKRLSDIRTIQTALEVYNLDNGGYPIISGSWAGSHTANWTALETLLDTTLPVDPINTPTPGATEALIQGADHYVYTYFANNGPIWCRGQAYMLGFQLEGKNGDGPNDGVTFCNNSNVNNGPITFSVGTDRDGKFITPDTSGSSK